MQVSQIFISDDASDALPPRLAAASAGVGGGFPALAHRIYTKSSLREFIASRYGGEVLWAYDRLRPYSYKADLGRYCLLHALGGWYFDITVRLAEPVELDAGVNWVAFRDIQRHSRTSWACATTVLYSMPDNPALETAIGLIVQRCRQRYYGVTPLCPTGPSLLGQALARHGANPNAVFGDYLELTPAHSRKNRAFVMPDGTILAWSKAAEGGDLTALGATGVNNYNAMWAAREVYAE